MPRKDKLPIHGYKSLMLRKDLAQHIEGLVDQIFPYHTVSSAIGILRDEIKSGRLKVRLHDIPYPPLREKEGGEFASISLGNGIIAWLDDERQRNRSVYEAKYGRTSVTKLGPFSGRFIINALLTRKENTPTIKIKLSTHRKLQKRYQAQVLNGWKGTYDAFVDSLLRQPL